MDFYSIREELKQYLLEEIDENGNKVFTQEDVDNQYSNISLLLNFFSFSALTLENKMRIYKENSILSTVTDFNLARQIAKIQGHNWKTNQPSTLKVDMVLDWNKMTTDGISYETSDVIVIPKFTNFTLGGNNYYNDNDLSFSPLGSTQTVDLIQGEIESIEFTQKKDLMIVFKEASTINKFDVFVERNIDGTVQFQTFYEDEEFLELEDNLDGENIYYLHYYEDNVMIRLNIDIPDGRKISVIKYTNDGYLDDFRELDFSSLSLIDTITLTSNNITTDISDYFYFQTNTPYIETETDGSETSKNILYSEYNTSENYIYRNTFYSDFSIGSNAETLSDLQALGSRANINRGVNENDFNEILKRAFPNWNLKVIGGDRTGYVKHLGYIIFTGLNEQNQTLTKTEIQTIKNYIDENRGLNLRVIYKTPTIINLDFDISLIMKPQYRGRLEEFKSQIRSDILNYVNTELYSDPMINEKEYNFNKIFLRNDDVLDFVERFDIIQKTSLRISNEQYEFAQLITGQGDTTNADSLFDFGTVQLTKDEVYTLYEDLNVITSELGPDKYLQFNLWDIYADLGEEFEIDTNLTYDSLNVNDTLAPLYKYLISDSRWRLIEGAASNKNYILADKSILTENGNVRTKSNMFYYKIQDNDTPEDLDLSEMTVDKKIFFELFKTTSEKFSLKDITFKNDVFVIADEITFE